MDLCSINSSMFKTFITIERLTDTPDGMGGNTQAWAADPAGGLYAHLKYLTGTERWEAQRIHEGLLLRAIIHYRGTASGTPYYTIADRVKWRGLEFAILGVHDIEFAGQYLQLELMQGRAT